MAKIQPKGKKVTGTKKKDKITWVSSKAWKKTLTVNSLAGNDIINFKKSKYNNTINGQDGNDVIYGGKKIDKIYGGKGNDKIYGYSGNDKIYGGKGNDIINAGKGNNTIYLNKNEGTDTILKGDGTDTIIFSQEKNFKDMEFYYNGNDLIFSAHGTKAAIKNFLLGGHSVKYIQAGNQKYNIQTSGTDNQDFINGTKGNDIIYGLEGDDIICTGSGNDTIYAGLGDDIINAGTGNNTIIIENNEGNDIVYSDKGEDTLKFRTLGYFKIKNGEGQNNRDLIISYNHDNEGNTLDSVTIKNYYNKNGNPDSSVKYMDIKGNVFGMEDIKNYLNEGCIISSETTIQGTENNDFIIATGDDHQWIHGNGGNDIIIVSDQGSIKNYAYGDAGDDEIYVSKNTYTWVSTGSGNDTIHAEDLSNVANVEGEFGNYYMLEEGNNTVYLGKRANKTSIISADEGNDTIYMPTEAIDSEKNNYFAIHLASSNLNGGHDTIIYQNGYTQNLRDSVCFNEIDEENMFFTTKAGSSDLVLRYGNDNDVTFKEYYKSGNENFGASILLFFKETYNALDSYVSTKTIYNYLTGNEGTVTGTDNYDYIKANSTNTLILNGGTGNDYYNVTFDGNRTINDTNGVDTLLLSANKEDISLLFNVKKDGNFAEGNDKLTLSSNEKDIVINDFDSIEKINSLNGYYIDTAKLNILKTDVVNWLNSANSGNGYADVVTALASNDSDLNTLKAYFTRETNWQSAS